ncbi:hypothetical protein [Acetobacterium malicum]|uniref:hypothetical protein n=1 Tax=Acetobacterium malicum TaxID=52692 RepID=UPI003592EE0C
MNSKHQHDENCGCGCHDDHHDHHNHSEHGHQPEPHHHTPPAIMVKTHDTSLVGSYRLTIETCFEDAVTILSEAQKKIAAEITSLGGIIGHIKANLTAAGQSCMISLTEDESDLHYHNSHRCQAEGVAIVFGIVPEQLTAILSTILGPYLNN